MMIDRRTLVGAGAFAVGVMSTRSLFAQEKTEDSDYDDVSTPFSATYRLYGTKPALGAEEDQAREILSNVPKGRTLLETARHFEQLELKNLEGHMYNAQWPKRWNPVIVGFYQSSNVAESYVYQKGDTIDWCAAFLNWCLGRGGYKRTNSAMSGSFRLGRTIAKATTSPKPGDIIVFKKADPEEAKVGFGHVGIFVEEAPGGFRVLGGNQKAGKRYSSVNTSFFAEKSERLVFDSFRSFDSIPKA